MTELAHRLIREGVGYGRFILLTAVPPVELPQAAINDLSQILAGVDHVTWDHGLAVGELTVSGDPYRYFSALDHWSMTFVDALRVELPKDHPRFAAMQVSNASLLKYWRNYSVSVSSETSGALATYTRGESLCGATSSWLRSPTRVGSLAILVPDGGLDRALDDLEPSCSGILSAVTERRDTAGRVVATKLLSGSGAVTSEVIVAEYQVGPTWGTWWGTVVAVNPTTSQLATLPTSRDRTTVIGPLVLA